MKWKDHPNSKRWLAPPTIEQIDAVVKATGASELQFERYYGIYPGCIKNIRWQQKRMPIQFWHLFLAEDKKVPDSVSVIVSKPINKLVSQSVSSKKTNKDSRISTLL